MCWIDYEELQTFYVNFLDQLRSARIHKLSGSISDNFPYLEARKKKKVEGLACTSNYSTFYHSGLQRGNLTSKYSAKPEQNNFLSRIFRESMVYSNKLKKVRIVRLIIMYLSRV